ncbi:hypothetical protein MMC13_007759 [Lambiella insularis]|nr:hypothetical protein [Lambiella insularis]
MPSIRYYNQTAPFWDFIASLESGTGDHPFFSAYAPSQGSEHRGPPPPPDHSGPSAPPEYDGPEEPSHPSGPPPPGPGPHGPPHHRGEPQHHHGGPPGCDGGRFHRGGPRRGGFGGRGGIGGGFPFGGQRGWGGFDGASNTGGRQPFDLNALVQFLSQRFGFDTSDETEGNNTADTKEKATNDKDFTPPCDVFDTPDAFILHLSLPGAKKEDVGVNWDADKSEVSIAGVVYRIGDEEMLKMLAMDERQVGVFERKVRLGSRANPASVDSDGISARMEDGVLVVKVPKIEEFVEVKKVDVE